MSEVGQRAATPDDVRNLSWRVPDADAATSPAGTAELVTSPYITSGALPASARPLKPARVTAAVVPTRYGGTSGSSRAATARP